MLLPKVTGEPRSDSVAPATALNWNRWIGRSLLILGTIMCLYVGVALWAARGDLGHAFSRLHWYVVPSVIGFVVLGCGLRALRWHYYVRHLQWPIPIHHSLMAFLASFAFTTTPGKAGELIKSVLLRTRYQVSLAEGAGVLLVERLGDLVAVLILATGGLALLADALVYFVVVAVIVAGIAVVVCNRSVYFQILTQIAKIHRFSALTARILHLLDTGRALLRPTPFAVGVGLALVAWSCEGWAFHVLITNFGVSVNPITSCSIFGIATLVGALSALPGGLGSFEFVMVLLLGRLGLPLTAASLAVVLFRLCTLWLGSFIGFVFLVGWLSFVSRVKSNASSQITK